MRHTHRILRLVVYWATEAALHVRRTCLPDLTLNPLARSRAANVQLLVKLEVSVVHFAPLASLGQSVLVLEMPIQHTPLEERTTTGLGAGDAHANLMSLKVQLQGSRNAVQLGAARVWAGERWRRVVVLGQDVGTAVAHASEALVAVRALVGQDLDMPDHVLHEGGVRAVGLVMVRAVAGSMVVVVPRNEMCVV